MPKKAAAKKPSIPDAEPEKVVIPEPNVPKDNIVLDPPAPAPQDDGGAAWEQKLLNRK